MNLVLAVREDEPFPVLARELDGLSSNAALNGSEADFIDSGVIITRTIG